MWWFWKGKFREGITFPYLWIWKCLDFFKHLLYMNVRYWRAKRARNNYNNKINTTVGPFLLHCPTHQISTEAPISDKSLEGSRTPLLDPPWIRSQVVYMLMHRILDHRRPTHDSLYTLSVNSFLTVVSCPRLPSSPLDCWNVSLCLFQQWCHNLHFVNTRC